MHVLQPPLLNLDVQPRVPTNVDPRASTQHLGTVKGDIEAITEKGLPMRLQEAIVDDAELPFPCDKGHHKVSIFSVRSSAPLFCAPWSLLSPRLDCRLPRLTTKFAGIRTVLGGVFVLARRSPALDDVQGSGVGILEEVDVDGEAVTQTLAIVVVLVDVDCGRRCVEVEAADTEASKREVGGGEAVIVGDDRQQLNHLVVADRSTHNDWVLFGGVREGGLEHRHCHLEHGLISSLIT
eukprot:SAG31_NODE_818_length_11820_cov_22.864431_2_plen_237_part_00